jgi:predicted amidohydrolase
MERSFVAAAVQLNSSLDKAANVRAAERQIVQAASQGAELVVLPELFTGYGALAEVVPLAEPIPGPTTERLAALAREHRLHIAAGLAETSSFAGKARNACVLIGPAGEMLAVYRKMHLFDVDLPDGGRVRESDYILPGEDVVVVDTPLGRCGLAICYDLRFPELFRRLSAAGAELLLFPSAFTAVTGRDHWFPLLQARAIENQWFMVAANQAGQHNGGMASFGHSCVLDPWGRLLAHVERDEACVTVATIDPASLRDVRQRLPALRHRKIL